LPDCLIVMISLKKKTTDLTQRLDLDTRPVPVHRLDKVNYFRLQLFIGPKAYVRLYFPFRKINKTAWGKYGRFNTSLNIAVLLHFILVWKPILVYSSLFWTQATTGTLLLARTADGVKTLSQQFSKREISKTYLALVRAGRETFKTNQGKIVAKLGVDADGRTQVRRGGIETSTSWELVASSVR